MIAYLKKLPVQLVLFLIIAFATGDYMSLSWVRGAFTVSTLLKDFLMLLLPFVVFSYIASGLMSFEEKAPLLILGLLVAVSLSNALAVSISYGVGSLVLPFLTQGVNVAFEAPATTVLPFFTLPVRDFLNPEYYSADKAMLLGLMVGLFWA